MYFRFSPARRWLTALNLFLATGAVLALAVMFNCLAAAHFKRSQWADATNFKLSPQTAAILKSLTNDVTITIFYQRKADVYTMISALLASTSTPTPPIFASRTWITNGRRSRRAICWTG